MNQDFRDLLGEFNARQVEFLLVGAHALAAHGHVRATQDLEVWVRPSPENAKRVIEALRAFGAPLRDLTEDDLSTPGVVFQIGVEPIRIDVLTAIHGVDFDEAWADRLMLKFADQGVCVLWKDHLIKKSSPPAGSKTWPMSKRSNATGKKPARFPHGTSHDPPVTAAGFGEQPQNANCH